MGEWGMTANGYGVSFQDDENLLILDSSGAKKKKKSGGARTFLGKNIVAQRDCQKSYNLVQHFSFLALFFSNSISGI